MANDLILLTGATGYVGGRLLRALEQAGHRVRCLARHPEGLLRRAAPTTTVVEGDVLNRESLWAAMEGVHTALYLVHSMSSKVGFEEEDRRAATAFGSAAHRAGAKKIIYLGGLGQGEGLSAHLHSRQEVGRILRESGTPTIEFRASIILGSGSFSFEMIRALVERLPVMITPLWLKTPTQPIAIEDVIAYLLQAIKLEISESRVFEIGGSDQVSYQDLLREYGRQRGLKRLMIPVPVLSPRLSSLWLGLVTPVFARIGRELVDGLRNETVVRDDSALEAFPVRPRGFRDSLERALANEDREFAETRWSDAFSSIGPERKWGGVQFGRRFVDSRTMRVPSPPDAAFRPVERLGGSTGWYYANWLWNLRGLIDLAVGGVGMRRGRRDPERVLPGDTIDCWRVEAVEPGRLLRLSAEMRLPGRAWLQFELEPDASGTLLRQTAIFDPLGLLGRLYWYLLYPLHQVLFQGMLRGIVTATGEAQ
ncbi:MAG: SDR family oxidoreductase [Candidatus Acidiferrum sp.]